MNPNITEQEILEISLNAPRALPSPEDYRYINIEHLAAGIAESPVDLKSFHIDFSQVPDLFQRKIGACTNHAYAEMYARRKARLTGQSWKPSPRFTYALCKIEDKIADPTEQGTFAVMPLKMGVKYGMCSDATLANDTTLGFDDYIFHRDIRNMPQGAFEEADQNRIPGYAQVGKFNNITAEQLKGAIMQYPDGVKLCLPVGSEWWTAADGTVTWDPAKILPIRKMVTQVSGHDITGTGWEIEDVTNRLKVFFRNHWSLDWANKDDGWFYFDQHVLSEAWVITEIPDALLAIVKSLPAEKDFGYQWTQDLKPGAQGEDVKNLQIALKIIGTFPFKQPITNYFGDITRKAVIDFQTEYKVASPEQIAAANGELGPLTRETINKMFLRN